MAARSLARSEPRLDRGYPVLCARSKARTLEACFRLSDWRASSPTNWHGLSRTSTRPLFTSSRNTRRARILPQAARFNRALSLGRLKTVEFPPVAPDDLADSSRMSAISGRARRR